jgi:Mg2+ and Co2+ transporter CorA
MYSDLIFISLDVPLILNENNKEIDSRIIFIITNSFIITIHDEPMEALGEFLNNLEMDTTLPEELRIKNNSLLFFYLIKNLYINIKEKLATNKIQIKEIENKYTIYVDTKKNN